MSSFQSFKSFMKIEENNSTNPASKPGLTDNNNQKEIKQIEEKQPSANFEPQSLQKNHKRFKKTGSVCNFIAKVYSMLQEKQIQSIISWTIKQPTFSSKYLDSQSQNNSSSFQIFDLQKFEEIILPKYFKHSNMSSFVRQLNMYGFHKLRGQKNNFQFQHEKFQKNRKDLLSQIRRKSPEFMGVSYSHLDEPNLKNHLQNQTVIDDKSKNQTNKLLNTQQEIQSFRQELNESNLFPSQFFIPLKKISLDQKVQHQPQSSVEKGKLKKMQLIEEQNNRLKKIKAAKVQKIKDLNSVNKENIHTKFSKILFTFLTLKIKSELDKSQFIVAKIVGSEGSQKAKKMTIHSVADHIMSSSEVQSFEDYQRMIQDLI